jgi:uncharacterized protein YggT (Ycf19 family)
MYFIAAFFNALIPVVDMFFTIIIFLFIGRAISSWVSGSYYNPIVQFLHQSTEIIIAPFRRLKFLYVSGFPLDLPFLVAFLFVVFLRYFLMEVLQESALFFRNL